MRDIVFGGKRVIDGKWVEGSLHLIGDCAYIFATLDFPEGPGWYLVDLKTIGQYIGRADDNGKKIFEGDELEVVRGGMKWTCVIEDIRNLPWVLFGSTVESIKVIGNIHDNPDLLGVTDTDVGRKEE